ncbi:MAG: glycosyltransferase family 4 protein [Acidobacteriota bacterium]
MNTIDSDPKTTSIIYAWNYIEWGGAQIYTLALIREVKKFSNVLVVLPAGSSVELLQFLDEVEVDYEFFTPKIDLDPATTLRRKIQRHWRKLRSETALVNRLFKIGLQDSAVHADFLPQQSFIPLLRLCRRVHVFFTMHNALEPMPPWREWIWAAKLKLLLRTGRFHIFCANENAKSYLERFISDQAGNEIRVTRAGIDPDSIDRILKKGVDRIGLLDNIGIPRDSTIVLTVGQFIDRKGRWTLLDSIREIVSERPKTRFLWVMPFRPSPMDQQKIDSYGVGDYFKTILSADIGSREDVLSFIRIADIYLLPSFVEGVPISLLEAMALGVPSISTNVNGIPEAIEDAKTGLLIQPGEIEDLKRAVLRMVDDAPLRNQLAHNGRSLVLSKFDERKAAEIAVREYRKIFARGLV